LPSITTDLAISYPTATDAVNQGPAAFVSIANSIDTLIPALAGDALQPGVLASTDGVLETIAVSGAGAVSVAGTTGGAAWSTRASGALVRNAIPTGSFSATPGSLPASGKYSVVGIDLVTATFGSTASLGLSSKGTDETSSALAVANSPAGANGRLRLLDVVILNTSGTYSLAASVDRRQRISGEYHPVQPVGNYTAIPGDLVVAAPGATITLPPAALGPGVTVVAASNVTGASPVTVAGSGIYGPGLNGVASFILGQPCAAVNIRPFNGTDWLIVSGGPDTGWVPLTLHLSLTAGAITPSVRLDATGTLRIKGRIDNNTGSSISSPAVIATIPSSPAGLIPTVLTARPF
jgi:hypothetical protein